MDLENTICKTLDLKPLRRVLLQGTEVLMVYNSHNREEVIRFGTNLRKGWQIKAIVPLIVVKVPEIVIADTSEPSNYFRKTFKRNRHLRFYNIKG